MEIKLFHKNNVHLKLYVYIVPTRLSRAKLFTIFMNLGDLKM